MNQQQATMTAIDAIQAAQIQTTIDLSEAIQAARLAGRYRELRLFAVAVARRVQFKDPDPRSMAALDVAARFANGEATQDELYAAWRNAWDVSKLSQGHTAWSAASSAAICTCRDAADAAIGVLGTALGTANWPDRRVMHAGHARLFSEMFS